MSYSKKTMEQPDFFIRYQRDLEAATPELVAEVLGGDYRSRS